MTQRAGDVSGRPAIWAVVPIKALSGAKSRLAPVLDLARRQALVLAMLDRTLDVLRGCGGLRGIVVVSGELSLGEGDLGLGVALLAETPPPNLNRSLTQASAYVRARGGQGMLVIPGDLPHLCGDSIAALVGLASPRGVVVAPDRHELGTNALLVTPPNVIPFCFGPCSSSGTSLPRSAPESTPWCSGRMISRSMWITPRTSLICRKAWPGTSTRVPHRWCPEATTRP